MKNNKDYLFSKNSALFTLAVFTAKQQTIIARELKEEKLTALIPRATQLHSLITQPSPLNYPINFRYKIGTEDWVCIQEWLVMTGPSLVEKGLLINNKKFNLNTDILLLIATFLAPLSLAEVQNFSEKLLEVYRPKKYEQQQKEIEQKTMCKNNRKDSHSNDAAIQVLGKIKEQLEAYKKLRESWWAIILIGLGFLHERKNKLSIANKLYAIVNQPLTSTDISIENIEKDVIKALRENNQIDKQRSNNYHFSTGCFGCYFFSSRSLNVPSESEGKSELAKKLENCLELIRPS